MKILEYYKDSRSCQIGKNLKNSFIEIDKNALVKQKPLTFKK